MPPHRYTASEYADMILIYGECQQDAKAALKKYKEKYGATRTCPSNTRIITEALEKLRGNQPLAPQQDESDSESTTTSKTPPQPPLSLEQREAVRAKKSYKPPKRSALQQEDSDSEDSTTASQKKIRRSQPSKVQRKTPKAKKIRKPPKSSIQISKRSLLAQTPNDPYSTREMFCQWLLDNVSEDPDFLANIMWTGESCFSPNGVTSFKNIHYWCHPGERPPQIKIPQGEPIKVHVWAAIHQNEIIGPIFIHGNLNTEKFLELLDSTVADYVDGQPLNVRNKLWYQLNGLPAHSVPVAREKLTDMFGDQWIGRYGPIKWPPQSADLSPLELFLWKEIKNIVYGKHMKDCAEELKKRITEAFDKIKNKAAKGDLLDKERNKVLKQCEKTINKMKK